MLVRKTLLCSAILGSAIASSSLSAQPMMMPDFFTTIFAGLPPAWGLPMPMQVTAVYVQPTTKTVTVITVKKANNAPTTQTTKTGQSMGQSKAKMHWQSMEQSKAKLHATHYTSQMSDPVPTKPSSAKMYSVAAQQTTVAIMPQYLTKNWIGLGLAFDLRLPTSQRAEALLTYFSHVFEADIGGNFSRSGGQNITNLVGDIGAHKLLFDQQFIRMYADAGISGGYSITTNKSAGQVNPWDAGVFVGLGALVKPAVLINARLMPYNYQKNANKTSNTNVFSNGMVSVSYLFNV